MAIITTGNAFGTTDPVTSTTLNNIANAATFNDPVDETSLELITSGTNIGKLHIKDGGVTKAKIENVANLRVLGNTSGSVVAPEEVEILDDDTMATADAATLATSESIKAYVDASSTAGFTPTAMASDTKSVTLPNGLIMKFGTKTGLVSQGDYTIDLSSESADFPNACLNASATAINANGDTSGENDYWMQVRSISSSEIVYVFQASDIPESGASFFWQAIGH
tara:strand:+ start:23 stop:694 length:672 start_codon:yes stop_codon:yes gene_type:complete